jgi:thiamine pyrophosphate-dependent acetolactate synthase large subunit-like protein
MPDDIIQGEVDADKVQMMATIPEPPRMQAVSENIEAALDAMESAERPLVIVGKGMAWSRAEDEVRAFIERTQLPFLASPMGKGVLDDNHPLSVGAARSHALKEADVIFLMGARLNWIMHYGQSPRFSKDVRVVQLDISPEAIGNNVPTEVALVGDGKTIVGQLNMALENRQWFYPSGTDWMAAIAEKAEANAKAIQPMIDDNSTPTNYYRALKDISAWATEDAVIIGEGANTMDIGRTQLPNASPRLRLDAGTYGTMGIGMGFAIAAAVVNPDQPVVSVSGDSALGFSGMEIETICRYDLPICVVVFNNGGIYRGTDVNPTGGADVATTVFVKGARYDKMMEAFGGVGVYATSPDELSRAVKEAINSKKPTLINAIIDENAGTESGRIGNLNPQSVVKKK